MTAIFHWVDSHHTLLGGLGAVSLFMLVGSLVAIPWLVIRIPADYFVRRHHFVDRWRLLHPLLRIVLLCLKNLCGVTLVLAGVAMLVLPGQGILTILVGLMFLDFPGKLWLERRLASQRPVMAAMNWMRGRAGRPPLERPGSLMPRDHEIGQPTE